MDVLYIIIGFIVALVNGVGYSGQQVLIGQFSNKLIAFHKYVNINVTNPIDLNGEAQFYAKVYCYFAIGTWIAGYLQCTFWSMSAIRQTHKIRLKYFQALLRQNIGWFDATMSSGLTTRMSE